MKLFLYKYIYRNENRIINKWCKKTEQYHKTLIYKAGQREAKKFLIMIK